jgi:O-antigen ligase
MAGALRLIQDRPLGAGGNGFDLLSPVYIPEVVAAHGGDLRAPHNTWAQVTSEWGILGLICYVGIYASAFVALSRVKRSVTLHEHSFTYWRALAVQLALVAFLVASTFTDRTYAEAGYWMVGLAFALYRIQGADIAEAAPAAAPTAEAAAPRGAAAMWPMAHAR